MWRLHRRRAPSGRCKWALSAIYLAQVKVKAIAYVLQRDETRPLPPFDHATVRGLKFMVPPQATAVHPALSIGATICSSTSKGADETSGIAMRYTMLFFGSIHSEKHICVPPGQYLAVVVCLFAGLDSAQAWAPLRARSTKCLNPIVRSC